MVVTVIHVIFFIVKQYNRNKLKKEKKKTKEVFVFCIFLDTHHFLSVKLQPSAAGNNCTAPSRARGELQLTPKRAAVGICGVSVY